MLVIEDDLPARKLYAGMLKDEGFDVAEAHNGLQAVEKAAELLPQVIVTDLGLPGIDGFEVCRRIHRDDRTGTSRCRDHRTVRVGSGHGESAAGGVSLGAGQAARCRTSCRGSEGCAAQWHATTERIMRLVIFGLTISSSWGNGHATIWRGLCRALHARGHEIVFFERDVPYYACYRDETRPRGCDLRLYQQWDEVIAEAQKSVRDADVAMVTSYCPDGRAAAQLVLDSTSALKVFYDLDTPVTLARLRDGHTIPYLPEQGLGDFDLVLSYTGGRALDELRSTLGARAVAPLLYGSVDADVHRPVEPDPLFACAMSYLGTFSPDRQDALDRLFLETARRRPDCRFALAGSQYPPEFGWEPNIFYLSHLTPSQHPAFYCSSGLTLNVTRAPMAEMGYCRRDGCSKRQPAARPFSPTRGRGSITSSSRAPRCSPRQRQKRRWPRSTARG